METHYWRTIPNREAGCGQIAFNCNQRAKKVVSDSLGLVDFAIGLVNFVLNLPDGLVKYFWEIQIMEELWNQFCSSKCFWG